MLTGSLGDLGGGSGSCLPRNIAVAASWGDGGQGDEAGPAGWAWWSGAGSGPGGAQRGGDRG